MLSVLLSAGCPALGISAGCIGVCFRMYRLYAACMVHVCACISSMCMYMYEHVCIACIKFIACMYLYMYVCIIFVYIVCIVCIYVSLCIECIEGIVFMRMHLHVFVCICMHCTSMYCMHVYVIVCIEIA